VYIHTSSGWEGALSYGERRIQSSIAGVLLSLFLFPCAQYICLHTSKEVDLPMHKSQAKNQDDHELQHRLLHVLTQQRRMPGKSLTRHPVYLESRWHSESRTKIIMGNEAHNFRDSTTTQRHTGHGTTHACRLPKPSRPR
jgi:hypothetical protein